MWQGRERVYPAASPWKFGVDVGAAFLIVTLGKRPPMPYVWLPHRVGRLLPRERLQTFGPLCGPQEWWKCLTPRIRRLGRIAQLVEQLTLNQRVLGSSPSASTTLQKINELTAHPRAR